MASPPGLAAPAGLRTPPDDTAPRLGTDSEGHATTRFFHHTDWRDVVEQPDESMRRLAWCSFLEPVHRPDGTWVPAMLAVPGDDLGLTIVPALSALGPVISPSLQISMQVHRPARGRWIGIDSRSHDTHDVTATGVATLWGTDGTLVATLT